MHNDNKKILHLSLNSLYTDGWSYQDQMLTKFHKKLGYEVTDITSHWINDDKGNVIWDDRDDYVNGDGVHVIRLRIKGKESFTNKFKRFPELYEAIEQVNPNIMFIHGVSCLENKTIVKYIKNHPNVVAYADNHADFSNSGTNWISKNILHKVVWRHYAKLLVPYIKRFYGVMPSRVDFLKDIYHIPADKVQLLVMGVDDDEVKKALSPDSIAKLRKQYDIADDDILVMTGGKIDMAKRQTVNLMQAINQLDNPKVKLIVFGSVVDELKAAVDAQCSDKCKYIGWINSEETLSYYGAADLVIFPGRHSVFWEQVVGIGKPMICKYWEGTTHVDLGGNVKFLYKDTVEELTEIINTVLSSGDVFRKMQEVAQSKGMEYFSYKQIAKKSIEI